MRIVAKRFIGSRKDDLARLTATMIRALQNLLYQKVVTTSLYIQSLPLWV
jgi:hypothetical protein